MANDAIIGAEIDAEPVEQSIGDFIGEQIDAAEASDIEPAPAVEENRDRAEEEPAPQEEAVEVSAEKTDEASAEPENEAITAPQSMSSKDREAFYTLPPESQKWISDRVKEQEADYTKKTMEVADQRKFYEKLEQAIAPHRQQFALIKTWVSPHDRFVLLLCNLMDADPKTAGQRVLLAVVQADHLGSLFLGPWH